MAWSIGSNVTAGSVLTASRYNQDVVANLTELAPFFVAWTDYTPTISQGASSNISKTLNYAKYLKIGRMVIVQLSVTMTGAGTTSNAITCTLPVTRANSTVIDLGAGDYDDSGTATYAFTARASSNNAFQMLRNSNDSGQLLGLGVAFAVANNDNFRAFLMYEAAS